MNDLLLQIILARRNNEVEGWMQILVFVVLAVFWAVGGIIKARSNKSQTGEKGNLPRKPVRKPPVHSREAREQMLKRLERPADSAKGQHQQPRPATQKPRMKFSDLRAAAYKIAADLERAAQPKTTKTLPEQESKLPEPQITPKIQPVSPTLETGPILSRASFSNISENVIKDREDKKFRVISNVPDVEENLSELLLDYADPEELRRAILHYEILGKPLSLRDPSEHGIGL